MTKQISSSLKQLRTKARKLNFTRTSSPNIVSRLSKQFLLQLNRRKFLKAHGLNFTSLSNSNSNSKKLPSTRRQLLKLSSIERQGLFNLIR